MSIINGLLIEDLTFIGKRYYSTDGPYHLILSHMSLDSPDSLKSTNAAHYWRTQIRRLRTSLEDLHTAIDEGERAECFNTMQVMENTLTALRASLRENMPDKNRR